MRGVPDPLSWEKEWVWLAGINSPNVGFNAHKSMEMCNVTHQRGKQEVNKTKIDKLFDPLLDHTPGDIISESGLNIWKDQYSVPTDLNPLFGMVDYYEVAYNSQQGPLLLPQVKLYIHRKPTVILPTKLLKKNLHEQIFVGYGFWIILHSQSISLYPNKAWACSL